MSVLHAPCKVFVCDFIWALLFAHSRHQWHGVVIIYEVPNVEFRVEQYINTPEPKLEPELVVIVCSPCPVPGCFHVIPRPPRSQSFLHSLHLIFLLHLSAPFDCSFANFWNHADLPRGGGVSRHRMNEYCCGVDAIPSYFLLGVFACCCVTNCHITHIICRLAAWIFPVFVLDHPVISCTPSPLRIMSPCCALLNILGSCLITLRVVPLSSVSTPHATTSGEHHRSLPPPSPPPHSLNDCRGAHCCCTVVSSPCIFGAPPPICPISFYVPLSPLVLVVRFFAFITLSSFSPPSSCCLFNPRPIVACVSYVPPPLAVP